LKARAFASIYINSGGIIARDERAAALTDICRRGAFIKFFIPQNDNLQLFASAGQAAVLY